MKPKKEDRRERKEKERGREGDRRREGRDRDREREREKEKERYREKDRREREERPKDREREEKPRDREREREKDLGSSKKPVSYFDKPAEPLEQEKRGGFSAEDKAMIKTLMKKEEEQVRASICACQLLVLQAKNRDEKKLEGLMKSSDNDGYMECYPGLAEMDDAMGDRS